RALFGSTHGGGVTLAARSLEVAPANAVPRREVPRAAWIDYWALTKPDVNLLIVITTAAAFCMARPRMFASLPLVLLLNTLSGTLLAASGAATLNQWGERRFDARMRRTARRPVAGGRIPAAHALVFGVLLSLAGLGELLFAVGIVPALLA